MFIELQNKLSTPTHDVFYAATDIQNPVFHIVRRDRDTHVASCNCLRADCEFARAIGTRTEDDEVSAFLAAAGHDPGCGGQEFSDEEMEQQRRIDALIDADVAKMEAEMEAMVTCPISGCGKACDEYEGEPNQRILFDCPDHGDVTDAIEAEGMQ